MSTVREATYERQQDKESRSDGNDPKEAFGVNSKKMRISLGSFPFVLLSSAFPISVCPAFPEFPAGWSILTSFLIALRVTFFGWRNGKRQTRKQSSCCGSIFQTATVRNQRS
jgi:hypothetical protein